MFGRESVSVRVSGGCYLVHRAFDNDTTKRLPSGLVLMSVTTPKPVAESRLSLGHVVERRVVGDTVIEPRVVHSDHRPVARHSGPGSRSDP